jgi:hypothetical protein
MAAYNDLLFNDSENEDYEDIFEDEFFEDDYEDDEEYDEESEMRAHKIFVSLQDSHVIQRLSFHKNMDGKFR